MTPRVSIDPVRCRSHGICALLLPERIELDRWGYPYLDPEPVVTRRAQRRARRAARACPRHALLLESVGDVRASAEKIKE